MLAYGAKGRFNCRCVDFLHELMEDETVMIFG